MVWLFAVGLLCLGGCAEQSPSDQFIVTLVQKMDQERAKLDSLPPDADLKTRFASVYVLDQAPRTAISDIMRSSMSVEDKAEARAALRPIMEDQDRKNLQIVLDHLPPEGWYLRSRYGDEVATTAFYVVQHSDVETWRRFVPVLEPLVAQGEVAGPAYALMYDRLALSEQRPQRYGSQVACENGRWVALYLEDPDNVDERRRAMGFPDTYAEYVAGFQAMPC
ncbi:DUF6624 domain-containing protein [Brevundimonas pishanensis]|uniref:DUF6624 domain-containing protein n=1 Tax=Brevundimonas pishanensis TaxID=2896315 RepID=UPI001FA80651|nr:DUF6624 domain-containing protein [Brevundimonas pishanensis]